MQRTSKSWRIGAGLALSAALAIAVGANPPTWVPQGPSPIIDTLLNVLPDGGSVGAIEAVAAHPTDPDILYVGSVNGGIWKTTNATAAAPTWVSLGDDLSSPSIGALEFDPTDGTHQTLLAGHGGTSSFARVAGKLAGLVRTTDGGATWIEISDPVLDSASVSAVAARGATLLASARGEGGFVGGLFRSTDTGATWSALGTGAGLPSSDLDVFDMVGDPTSTLRLYAGVEDNTTGAGAIFRSANTGASWTDISSGNAALSAALADPANVDGNGIELAVASNGRLYAVVIKGNAGQPSYIGYTDNPTAATPTWVAMDLPLIPEGPDPLPIADASGGTPIVIRTPTGTITGATNATPIVITSAGHGRSTGDRVYVEGVTGNTAANGYFDITVLGGSTFQLDGSAGSGAYSGGGTWGLYHFLSGDFGTNQVHISGVTGNTAANGHFIVQLIGPTEFELLDYYSVPVAPSGAYTGGGSFQIVTGVSPGALRGGQGAIHNSLVVDPADPETIYIGGDTQAFPFDVPNSIGATEYTGRLFRGDASVAPTGGAPSPQWEHLTHSDAVPSIPGGGTASSTAPHADSRQMVFNAAGNLIEVDDGGIFKRTSPGDNTGDWFSMAGSLQITEFHDIAYDSNSDIVFGGTQDNGTVGQQTTGSATWVEIYGGDGGDGVVETASSPGNSVRYVSAQFFGGFSRRTYDAANNETLTVFPALQVTDGSCDSGCPTWFYGPVEVNAIDPLRVVIGLPGTVYESFDQAETFASVDPGSGIGANGNFSRRTMAYGGVLSGSPDADLLYFGFENDVYVRLAAPPTAPSPTAGAFPGDDVQAMRPDPDDWDRLVVIDVADRFLSTASSRVWLTEDTGATWTEITGDLPTMELQSVEYLPGAPDRIVVAGKAGVWTTPLSSAGTWSSLPSGLPTTIVAELYYDRTDDVLVAGTLGRGAYLLADATCGEGAGDTDGDQVCDGNDNCPRDPNAGRGDLDGDGVGDACDNCPALWNADQSDLDDVTGFEALWKLDEGSGSVAVDSVGGHNGAITGPLYVPGRRGTALEFDGVDDKVVATGYAGVLGAGDRTVTAWIRTTELGNFSTIVHWGSNGTGQRWTLLVNLSGRLRIEVSGGGLTGTTYLVDGQWHHVAVVFANDGTPTIADARLYVDGQLETATVSPANVAVGTLAGTQVTIGRFDFGADVRVFDGSIDEVAIYSRALSASEVQARFDKGPGDGVGDACDVCALADDSDEVFIDFLGEIGPGQLLQPQGVTVDAAGWVYVTSSQNGLVEVFDADRSFLLEFGGLGTGPGELQLPAGIAVEDATGFVFVADQANNRVSVFDGGGAFQYSFDSTGSAAGALVAPHGIAFVPNPSPPIYRFDVDGFASPASETESGFVRVTEPGMIGNSANGAFVATGTDGPVTLTVSNLTAFRDRGEPPGGMPFKALLRDHVGLNPGSGSLVITLSGLPSGTYDVTSWHQDWNVWSNPNVFDILVSDANGVGQLVVNDGTSPAFGDGQQHYQVTSNGTDDVVITLVDQGFHLRLNGIRLARKSGDLHVVDSGNDRVQVFDTGGGFLYQYGSSGSGVGQLSGPTDIAHDGSGTLWVADTGNDRLHAFLSTGTPGATMGSSGSGPGQFQDLQGVEVDPVTGEILVSDVQGNRVQRLTEAGAFLRQFGSSGDGPGQFDGAAGIAVGAFSTIYVADSFNNRLHVWQPGSADFDQDGDGNCGDCDPLDSAVYSGATEVCDGLDNDCDTAIDEGFAVTTWYQDADGDGFGDAGSTTDACAQPPGFVASAGDCDDSSVEIWAIPSESRDLLFGPNKQTLSWSAPLSPGGQPGSVLYDMLRSGDADDFTVPTCVESNDGSNLTATDGAVPAAGSVHHYLSRPENLCGAGSLGVANPGGPRPPAGACPIE